jgi:hypothetical protein
MADPANVVRTFMQHPRFVLMRSIARFGPVRSAAVRAQRAMREPLDRYVARLRTRTSEFFGDLDPVAVAATVERDGFARGIRLPGWAVEELVKFARTDNCWAEQNPHLGFPRGQVEAARQKLGRRFLLAFHFNTRRRSPLIGRLAQDPVLLEIAARYLGTVPTCVGTCLWWSFPEQSTVAARNRAAQMYHFDLDDFKFIKFFFYLTDVDLAAGPHVIVQGTHRAKQPLTWKDTVRIRRFTDEEIASAYGTERINVITGPAGTGFAEDTLCIHKGDAPRGSERLVFQIQYALNDFGNHVDDSKLSMIV